MGNWVLLSFFAAGVVGFVLGLNSAGSVMTGILGFLGAGFLADLAVNFPSDMIWGCEEAYENPFGLREVQELREACLRQANNFRWYLLAAGVGGVVGWFFGDIAHDKMEEKKKAS